MPAIDHRAMRRFSCISTQLLLERVRGLVGGTLCGLLPAQGPSLQDAAVTGTTEGLPPRHRRSDVVAGVGCQTDQHVCFRCRMNSKMPCRSIGQNVFRAISPEP